MKEARVRILEKKIIRKMKCEIFHALFSFLFTQQKIQNIYVLPLNLTVLELLPDRDNATLNLNVSIFLLYAAKFVKYSEIT